MKATEVFETAKGIELQVAVYFGTRSHVIVPNISWSMLPYEADLVIMHKSRYADEVEIKVSRSDLLRDGKKYHQHDSNIFRRLWFAIPRKLENDISEIPERAGILIVERSGIVRKYRQPKINGAALHLSEEWAFNLARLGCMRMWTLKYQLLKMKFGLRDARDE